ncbi:sacsin-like [Lineus longissimus]|uniref:sacsin-like n=1 Tax=Lineus longissimus TaxID=88925 RepID=UPI00315C7B64
MMAESKIGARPRLTWKIPTRLDVLQDILSQYPDDGQILKEILQNAEDAGASHAKFIYDKHEYTKEGLDPKLAKFQGPALYAYNDAVFSDKDFENLLNIQHSSKREERTKVGRFGRGFKSVFHMTEIPVLLSGSYFGRVNPYNDGEICWSLSEVLYNNPVEFESFFGKFGFNEAAAKNGFYKGTVFRFPLRQEVSELCETLYGEEKIKELFRMLEGDVYMNLLFLKSLESIEVFTREVCDESSEGMRGFSVELKDISMGHNESMATALEKRQTFFSDLDMATDEVLKGERRLTYQVEFKTSAAQDDQRFVVCHYYNGKKDTPTLKKLLEDPNFSYLPLASVAMPIGCDTAWQTTESQLFCFFPLPLHDNTSPTCLPIHVNAFFVVSSNRSEIKWPTTGQNVDKMTKDLQWNRCLITELLPQAYAHLLEDATALPDVHRHDICSAFPNIDRVNEKWKDTLLPPFLRQVHMLSILPTSGSTVTKYVCLKDAVLCPPSAGPEIRSALTNFLIDAGRNPVCVPEYMIRAVKSHSPQSQVTEATPMYLCQLLKECKEYQSYSRDDKLRLLQHLFSEADDTIVDLDHIQLLPLANQRFTEFDIGRAAIYIGTEEERALLPNLQHKFLSDDLDPSLKQTLAHRYITDNTQLTLLQADDILELLSEIMPRIGSEEKILKLKPGKELAPSHLTAHWCERVWHFFTRISEDHPDHLDMVRHLHLLPVVNTPSDFHLTRLSGGAVCIAASLHNEALPDEVSEALAHFGVHVLHGIPDVIRHHPYVFDKGFVHQPNALSVMMALMKVHEANTNICNLFNTRATNDQRRALLVFLEPLRCLQTTLNCKPLLRKLQLFQTVDGSGKKPQHPASIAEVEDGVTSYNIPVKPRCKLLDLSLPDTLLMAKFIGVNVVSDTMIIERFILDDIRQRVFGEGDVISVMLHVLTEFKVHVQNSETIIAQLEDLAFLEDEERHYRKPCELFDPSDGALKQLFAGENKFPSKDYHACLEPLRTLGLKRRSQVIVEDLNHSAALVHREVQRLKERGLRPMIKPGNNVMLLKRKSGAIATLFLEKQSMKSNQKSRRLKELEWVPIQTEKPKSHPSDLCWNPEQKLFDKPGSVALTTYTSVIGSSLAIADSSFVPDRALEAIFGVWTPPCEKVVEHLRNLSRCFSTRDKPTIMAMVQAVYELLKEFEPWVSVEKMLEQNLTDWVWHGDGFTSVESVAISQQFNENLTPYAYTLPRELLRFHGWLLKMGVKPECNPVEILRRMKDWHEDNRNISVERVNHDRSIAVNLINKIVEAHPRGVPGSIREDLVLPIECSDGHLSLLAASSCTYHDKEWKLGELIDVEHVTQEDDETLHFLHRSISKATATALGVATMMNRLLEGDCEGFEFAAEFEGYGQKQQPLTARLNNILKDYPDGLAIPKELIQNADDAGATEIKFMFDERENEDAMTGLLDEGMKQCQGPALWIYNNAEFSDEDLANIQKLSGATKEDKKDKIGKFGLGFNAVYNVTDVPSFVTKEYAVFFDPHRSHLGKAMPRNDTGLKVNLCTGSKRVAEIRKQLFNQFVTYNGVFGCQMAKVGDQKTYPGTLFRLPLRKPGTVSEIKNVPYSRKDIVELLQLLLNKADELLLFTQNVQLIEVHHLPKNMDDPQSAVKLYTAERNMVKTLKSLPSPLIETLKSLPMPQKGLGSNLLMLSHCMNPRMPQEYPNGLHLADTMQTKLEFKSASSTLGLKNESRTVHWFRYGCFGLGQSLTLALKSKSEIPVAGVVVKHCPHRDSFHPMTLDSAPVYCHLPLPSSVKSGLPVIVNGCFAVKADRRHLVELTDDDKQSAMNEWNEHLQEDVITEAYLGALELMTREAHTQADPYSLWPRSSLIEKQFETFHQSFYTCLRIKTGRWSPKIFTNGKTWVDFQHAVFLDERLISSDLKHVALHRLQVYLNNQPGGRVAIDLPMDIRKELGDLTTKTYSLTGFFEKAVLPSVTDLDQHERDAMLLMGLKCTKKDSDLKELFQRSSCIPVQPKGMTYSKPGDLVSPNGRCSSLFDTGDDVYPTENFCNKEYIGILESMGMKSDHLSWEWVIKRANSVQSLPIDRSVERTNHILAYISWKHGQGTRSADDLEKLKPLRQVKFLPVLRRPDNYPLRLKWKGDNFGQSLVAAVDLYLPKHQSLLGSTCPVIDEQRVGLLQQTTKSRLFLEEVLGLKEKKPMVCDVITQLQEVSQTDNICTWIKDNTMHVYSYINSCCSAETNDARTLVARELGKSKCILVDDYFMYPEHCAINFLSEIPPFLSKVPYLLISYKYFLAALNVRDSFEPIDFVKALHRIDSIGAGVTTVREIAECLHNLMKERGASIEEVVEDFDSQVLLPSAFGETPSSCELRPVGSLCLNLCPWLEKPVVDHKLKYVHTAITPEVAKALGVKTDGENIFETLGCGFGDPFGQREKLTTRIKNILDGYPCDEGILKELLQNADDAGASELRFILDTRTLDGKKIFHEKWKEMQGPALCIFNNRPFTEDDLIGISRLGQGSKSRDTTKTGQYGVGFNCVYHLTDVPSFLTDVERVDKPMVKALCFFDPNCGHVKGATETNPGKKIQGEKFVKMKEIFPDMCQGYFEDKFHNPQGSTMFRLPLRTTEVAESSDISTKVITIDMMEGLMNTFKDELFYSLLFVNSVRCVSLERIGQTGHIYTVNVSLSGEDEGRLSHFNSHVKQIASQLKKKEIELKDFDYKEVIYALHISDSNGRKETWSVCQCIGFKGDCVPQVVADAVTTGDIALLPRGGAAHRRKNYQTSHHRLFCFLPMPVDTPLPVHLNGHFALDQERRALLDDVEGKAIGFKQAWNTMLMEQVIPHAYISLVTRVCNLLSSREMVESTQLISFYRMFPEPDKSHSKYIQTLCEAFYTILKTNDLRFLAVQIPTSERIEPRWFSVKQCTQGQAFFDNTEKPSRLLDKLLSSEHQHATSTGDILCRIGFNLLAMEVPRFIHNALLLLGANVLEVEPVHVLNFLYRYKDDKSCKLKKLPVKVKNTPFKGLDDLVKLTGYCCSHTKDESRSLQGLPLCATKDGFMHEFQAEPGIFSPRFSSLVPQHPAKFLEASVYRSILLARVQASPCCVKHLTIETIVPFLTTGYSKLLDNYRWNWDPNSNTGQKQLRWIQTLWRFIQEDVGDMDGVRLELLKEFCIIPTQVTNGGRVESYLYPLKDVGSVVDLSTPAVYFDQTVQEIVRCAGVPILDLSACPKDRKTEEMPRNLVSNVRDARGILKALSGLTLHANSANQLTAIMRDRKNASAIVKYLSHSLKDNCTEEEAEQFLSLPIHAIASGNVVSLRNCFVYLVPKGLPKAGLDNWYSEDNHRPEQFIFTDDDDIHAMYKNIGSIEKTKVDLYAELILVSVNFQHFLNDEEKLEHLRYIKDWLLPFIKPDKKGKKEKQVLLAALQSLPFLKDKDEVFRQAKEFFSPFDSLFQVMEKSFPPKAFHHDDWIEFLGECGLRHRVTGEDLVRYARQVEEEGKRPTEQTETKAMMICAKLPELAHEKKVLFQVKDIKFLPIGKIGIPFSDLHHQYKPDQSEYVSFEKSVFYTDYKYCWTVRKVLPQWLQSDLTYSEFQKQLNIAAVRQRPILLDQATVSALQMQCPVPPTDVVAHVIELSSCLAGNSNRSTRMTKIVMEALYKNLDDRQNEIAQGDLDKLAKVPLITVDNGKRLVRPNQVVVKLLADDAIEPYLYVLPEQELLKYAQFFSKIGVKMEVDCKHFMNVLQLIREECTSGVENVTQLDPKQLEATEKAIIRFFSRLGSTDGGKTRLAKHTQLYLLSKNHTLELSTKLVQVDKLSWDINNRMARAQWPLSILKVTTRLHDAYANLSKLPEVLQPKLLSDLVEEDIDESCLASVENIDEEDTLDHSAHVNSEEFRDGLNRILRQELGAETGGSFEEYWDRLLDGLTSISFHSVVGLRTVLKMKDGDTIKNSSVENKLGIFIKTLPDHRGARVYIERGKANFTKEDHFVALFIDIVSSTFPRVSEVVKNLLGRLIKWDTPDISDRLDQENIRPLSWYEETLIPNPGEVIQRTLHGILKQDIGIFKEGDIVGFKTAGPFSEEFVYAKVISCEGGYGDDFQKYKVDIGVMQVVVFASDIYKFHREKLTSCMEAEEDEVDFDKVRQQLATDIAFAYQNLSVKERAAWVIRTISKWQPDNNPSQEQICRQILKFVEGRIAEEESKRSDEEDSDDETETKKSASNMKKVFEYTAERAREHKEHIQQQRKWLESNSKMSKSLKDPVNYDFFRFLGEAGDVGKTSGSGGQEFYDRAFKQFSRRHITYSSNTSPIQPRLLRNPRPEEARQWFQQAEADLNASRNDSTPVDKAYEWAVFKCHRAAEKALKAAYLTKGGDNSASHDLKRLASRVGDSELSSLARQIADITGDGTDLQYPRQGQIPHVRLSEDTYTAAHRLTKRLLRTIHDRFFAL